MENKVNTITKNLRLTELSVGLFSTLRVVLPQVSAEATEVQIIVTNGTIATAYDATWSDGHSAWICDIDEGQFSSVGKQKYEVCYKLDDQQFYDGAGWVRVVPATVSGIVPTPVEPPSRWAIVSITQGDKTYYADENGNIVLPEGGGGGGVAQITIPTTWSGLVALRNEGGLVAGCKYRITDYKATVVEGYTKAVAFYSADHNIKFDIIVTALDERTLSEEASAIQSADTEYFDTNNLAKWKVWYCLDNDTERFDWADNTSGNGKGVVYRLRDEFNNECWYDFKGIILEPSNPHFTFGMRYQFIDEWDDESRKGAMHDCEIKVCTNNGRQTINTNFLEMACSFIVIGRNGANNKFFDSCSNITLDDDCWNNSFNESCRYISCGRDCNNNLFGSGCKEIELASGCCDNDFEYQCKSITLGDGCINNKIYEYCSSIVFGSQCKNNELGGNSYNIRFGSGCVFVLLGDAELGGGYSYTHNVVIDEGVNSVSFTGLPEGEQVQNVELKSGLYGKVIPITYANMIYRDPLTVIRSRNSYDLEV